MRGTERNDGAFYSRVIDCYVIVLSIDWKRRKSRRETATAEQHNNKKGGKTEEEKE